MKNTKYTTETYIQQSKTMHGDLYDYERTIYTRSTNDIIITCRIHGDFEVHSSAHISQSKLLGCPTCKVHPNRNTTAEFVKNATEKHKGYYSYDETVYVTAIVPVIITCPVHGNYLQTPRKHIGGSGCIKCHTDGNRIKYCDFLIKAEAIHGDKYEYNEKDYITYLKKMNITCKKHGVFSQVPYKHIWAKQGCTKCTSHGFNPSLDNAYFYIQELKSNDIVIGYKIGITHNLEQRMTTQARKTSLNQELIFTYVANGDTILELETEVKKLIPSELNLDRDLFGDGFTETFSGDSLLAEVHDIIIDFILKST